ncbi:T9SS type B sorting domain-containing protein [Pontibacter pamirensis]|uniref:T9SS type B sorting domain-containing protein n=1 Tax=Pontibacter pamirensis TaxID=2562824 RepID=UPI001389E5F5|nr:gliding motility-associated C-terminal domain-containing protein [Pontibacter pamirensis]
MTATLPPPLRLILSMALLWFLQLVSIQNLYAQGNNATPTFNVDLTADPNGVWTSENVTRNGQLCGAANNENCVQFNITLNSNSGGLQFLILSGPVPSGSMGYQIDCGPQVPVGQPICVSGPGPHILTLCMPGNAKGIFEIRSVPAFNPVGDISVTTGCSAVLRAPTAFREETITWRDVSGRGYEKFLSFPNGKANPVVRPDATAPEYVDYEVCGTSQTSECATLPYCDVVRVFFFPPPVVTIGPNPAIICPGGSSVELLGNVTGGDGEFEYIWTDGADNVVGNALNYTASAIGTYTLEVRNKNYPNCQKFSASVNVVTNLMVNAGPEQLVCSQNPVQLAGTVTAATGGIWSGGSGTFSDRTALNAVYTPSAADISAGSVRLTLTSTGNGSCTAVTDEVLIRFYNMNVSLTGPNLNLICDGNLATITANVTGAQGTVSYRWNTGETTAAINNKPAGTYTVMVRDGNSCAIEKSITITQATGPTALAASLKASTCGNSNGEISITGVTGGTPDYTYSRNGTTFQSAPTFTGLAAGNYTITVKDRNQCTFVQSFTLTNSAGPTAVAATFLPASCQNNDGSINVGTVTGGTAPYSYAVGNSNFQTSTAFTGLAAGTYIVTAKDVNGCSKTTSVTVTTSIPTNFTSTSTAATCGSNSGEVTVTGVTGGIAPYTYSKDGGTTFQNSATLQNLLPGPHTITVKDDKGCIISKQVQVGNVPGPTDLTASIQAATCGSSNGEITVTGVTGGTGSYTYSKNGINFQSSTVFSGLAIGAHTITVKDERGCTYSEDVAVGNIAGPTFSATAQASTCGNSNGSISISNVTGGVGPYTYSRDGVNYQTGTTFTNLEADTYTIYVKDANDCVGAITVTVEDIAGPSGLELEVYAATCGNNNGYFRVIGVTGGTGPYMYARNGVPFQDYNTFGSLAPGEYTITVRDAKLCTYTESLTILDLPGPSDFAGIVKPSTCGQSNGEITITEVIGGSAPYRYSRDGGTTYQSSNVFIGLAAGTHIITLRDKSGCILEEEFDLTDIAGPTAVAATSIPASCANNDGTITAGTVTGGTAPYTYSIDGSNFQSETAFAGVASGTYSLTAKDAKGCIVTRQVSVTKTQPTNFTFTTTSSTCGNSNGQITVTGVTGGTAPYKYSKDGASFQDASSFTGLLAGAYTITVKDDKGCTYAKQVQVNNMTGPTGLTAAAQASTCGNRNGQIVVSAVTGGTAPYTYRINEAAYQGSGTFANLLAGTYAISVKDDKGCVYTEEVVVTNIAGPEFTAAAQASTCGNSNGRITISGVTGGTAPYAYSKDGTNFQEGTTFSALAAGDYIITVKDANGCFSEKTVTISNIAGPTDFTLANTSATCGGNNGKLEVTGVTGGTENYTYSINGGSFRSASTFGTLPAGNYTVTVKDANGCTVSKSATINNVAGPTNLAASLTASTCGNSNGELIVTSVTGGTEDYTYSKDGVNFQASATFTALAAGQHAITVKDANGCTFVKSFTITNIAGPTAVAATSQPASCQNNDGTITAGTVTGGKAPYTYAINGSNFQTGATFSAVAAGTYTLVAKDDNGCTVTRQVTVGTNVPTSFTSTSTASTCGNSNGQFSITGVTGGTAPYTYSTDGTTFQTNATFTALAAGAYQVRVKDAKGCTYTGTVQVSNIAGPAFTASAQATTCGNSNGSITISNVTGGTTPYTYSKDGTNFQASTTFDGLLAGEYTIVTKDNNGCFSSTVVEVEDIAGPDTFELTTAATTCGNSNGSITVGAVNGGTAPYTYAIGAAAFQSTATFTAVAAGDYTITVKDANGCTVAREVTIENVPGPADFAVSNTSSTCGNLNGTLEVTGVTGGTAPYTFSLNGSSFQSATTFAGLAAGQYTVTVKDDNGCTHAKRFTISNIAGPTAITATSLPATCADNDGTITAGTVTGGTAPYSYAINGSSFQSETAFAGVASGTYTLTVKDNKGCTVSTQVTVGKNVPTSFTSTTTASTCGGSDGQLTITGVTGGRAPYTYSIDGTNFQDAATFTALAAGAHAITVKDANGCTYTNQVQVNNLSGPSDLVAFVRATTCGAPNGTINITSVSGGNPSYTYSLDGVNFQSAASFAALAAGAYQVSVKDASGCMYTEEVVVTDIAAPAFTATAQASTCGNSNGSITISDITSGTAPFSFSKNGVNFQTGNTFSGLAAGTYNITVEDANGCQGTVAIELENIPGPTDFTLVSTSSTCGRSNGSITASAVMGGTAPYSYSIDGTNFQNAAAFETVRAGNYTLTVKDANGCIISKSVSVSDIAGPTNLSASLTASTCGDSNGELIVTGVTGGTGDYTYSKDGVNFQSSATFTALAAGQHAITVKDANGCTFVRSFTITNIAGPTAVAATSLPATCADNDGTITAGAVTGGTAPYTYSINGSNFQSETAFAGVASGTYTLTVKDDKGCTVSTEVTVGQNIPTSFTSTTTASTCNESNGQFTITGVTGGTAPYTYSTDGSTFQNTATFTALAAGVYEVTVKDAKGCVFTDEVQLNNVGGPAFTATAQAATCGNNNGRVSASGVTGGTAPYMYSIDGETFQAAATFSNLAAGTYHITTQDANGCSTVQSVEVEDITGPSEFELLATASTCGNSTGSITASAVTDGTAPYSYSINGTDFQAAATFEALAAGEYTVTVKDANGCTIQKITVVENVNGPTDFTASTASSFCGNPNGEVTVGEVTGGVAPYTYSKDGATFQTSTTLTGLAAGDHTVIVKDANGCTFSKVFIITNIAGPSALAATSQPTTCAGNDGSITVGEVTGGTAPYAYSLDGISYQSATTFAALAPQEYQVYVKDANDCSTSITVAVSSQVLQEATFAATPTGCATSTGTVTVTAVTGGTAPYAYSINGGTFQASALFENLAVGSYTITVKDAAGCTLSRTQDVVSTGGATSLTATTTNSSCGSADGSITISNVSGGRSPYTYSVGKSPYTFSSEETIFQEQAVFTNLTAGNYQIFVKDAEGCIYEQTTTIDSNDELANLQVNVTPVGCDQNSGQVLVSGLTGGTAPYTYSLDGINFQASATFTGVAAGQYELTVKDATNCSITTTVEVGTVSSTLAHVKDETCFGAADGEIAIAVTGATDETEYSIDNGASYQKEAVFANLPRGVYQVITRFSATCSITIETVEVTGPAEIIASVTPLTKSLGLENTGSAAITKVEGGAKPYSYKVDNGGFTTATEFNNLSSGTHTLVVKDANGCTTEVTFTIEALDDIEFPNGFTPNGDGLNDKWAIKNLSTLYPRCRVTVYNRWGSLVFESIGYNKEWDGTFNGKKLPDGTYYSIIEFGDGRAPMKKSLTIMR